MSRTATAQPACTAGQSFWFLGTRMTLKTSGAETGGVYGLIEQTAPPGFGPPPHIHHAEDEQFLILEGQVTFQCGNRTLAAGPGDFVSLPRGVRHAFTVEGATPARLLQFTTPAGLEQFFLELGTPDDGSGQPPSTPPDIERMLALAGHYRIEF